VGRLSVIGHVAVFTMRGRKAKERAPFPMLSFPLIRKGLSRALPVPAPWLQSRDGTEQPKRPGVSSEVALRNDCPLSIRYAYDFEAFLPEMFQHCQGLSAGGTGDHNGGTVFGVSRFNNKIHDCTKYWARM
jgi:hypothetical protein